MVGTRALLAVATLLLFCSSHAQQNCHAHDNSCRSCIRTMGCQWCSSFDSDVTDVHHCFSIEESNGTCKPDHLYNPRNSHEILVGVGLTGSRSQASDSIVQLYPQKVKLNLRKGTPYNFKVKFRSATDYPIDLYYLMDLSKSMEDDKKNLAKLGSSLADAMRSLTSKFRLGFGSYVDKVVLPFVNVHKDRIINPCPNCAPPYSFRNNLPLNADEKKFATEVNNAPISGNVDAPEGSLDALLQAIVCTEQIGWRQQARRLLIISTDSSFHHAGDGKLAGIIAPHDGKCHLDSKGEYTHYDKLDYPSVAQINKAAQENQVNIIFAVSAYDQLYKALSAQVAYSTQGMLDGDSSNVVDLVREQYNMISSVVTLTDNVESIPGAPLRVRYYTRCKDGTERETRSCHEIKRGDEVEFVMEIEVISVPEDENVRNNLQLNVTTFQDTVTFDIDIQGECPCEQPDYPGREINSADCSGGGTLQCGVCECNAGSYGNNCQCSSSQGVVNPDNAAEDSAQCIDEANGKICSSQGTCQCGICICNSKALYGKYCECNENHCKGSDMRVCSGRGTCNCGKCNCNAGFSGSFCECRDDQACKMPGSDEVCSGFGECDCGKCSCKVINNVPYTGPFCEECPTCSTGKCNEFKDCVQCKVFNTGVLKGEDCNKNCSIRPTILSKLEVSPTTRLCTFLDETTGCDFNFTYEYRQFSQDYFIFAQKPQECPEDINVFAVVLGVVGAVVLIGILTLLLWKILTTLHDRREYARFKKETENVAWARETNPVFVPAVGNFVNPAFGAGK